MQNNCAFCKIAAKEIPVRVLYEDEEIMAFPDINPVAPVHALVIPKRHIPHLLDAGAEDKALLAHVMATIPAIADRLGLSEDGFRVVTNVKQDGGQTVFHLHWHILGGRFMNWPPG